MAALFLRLRLTILGQSSFLMAKLTFVEKCFKLSKSWFLDHSLAIEFKFKRSRRRYLGYIRRLNVVVMGINFVLIAPCKWAIFINYYATKGYEILIELLYLLNNFLNFLNADDFVFVLLRLLIFICLFRVFLCCFSFFFIISFNFFNHIFGNLIKPRCFDLLNNFRDCFTC